MNLMISEVQITCIILMGLLTMFLAVVISRYTVVGKTYNFARKILTLGTFFVTVHFIIQYGLHKMPNADLANQRTLVNLVFGIPMSYCFNLSNIYILKKRKISFFTWWFAPILWVVALLVLAVCKWMGELRLAAVLMSCIYALTLVYYGVLQIQTYRRVIRAIRSKNDLSLLPYIKWTRWSLFVMVVISFGFPIMTFAPNLLLRSLYGLLSITVGFFYALSFMGYGINGAVSAKYAVSHGMRPISRQYVLKSAKAEDTEKMASVKERIEKFVRNGSYLRNGITQKEAAEEMGISIYRLKSWLGSTDFETFSRWLVYLRLVRAKSMLKEHPDMGCDVIAESCGFCDRQYFQRFFRKWMGMTPSQWLKKEEMEGLSREVEEADELARAFSGYRAETEPSADSSESSVTN